MRISNFSSMCHIFPISLGRLRQFHLNACTAQRSFKKLTNSVLDVKQREGSHTALLLLLWIELLDYFTSFSSVHELLPRRILQDQLGVILFPPFFLVPVFRNPTEGCATFLDNLLMHPTPLVLDRWLGIGMPLRVSNPDPV